MNESFGKEFDALSVESNQLMDYVTQIRNKISDIPAITDLNVCLELEKEYFNLGEYTRLLGDTFFKLSQMYHYVRLVNKVTLDEQ
jgi:hypothetical protein